MIIGILSDTHLRSAGSIPPWVTELFVDTDLIIHAGDLVSTSVLLELTKKAPVYAVRGNCDFYCSELSDKLLIKTDYGMIAVAHQVEHARKAVQQDTFMMIYGHTHLPLLVLEENLLILNPGSPTSPRGGFPPTVAKASLTDSKILLQLYSHSGLFDELVKGVT